MKSDVCPIITKDHALQGILSRVETIAKSDCTVLLVGETGVGKELFADFIHHSSERSGKPFIKLEAAAFPHELLESELFGFEKGAFTSAFSTKKGLFELANTGTLFLDDIDDFPVQLQAKLLRAIEAREVLRLGGTRPTPVDIRLIAATKLDLVDLVKHGSFRSDLYYRLNEVPVQIPPLRERRQDIPILASAFLQRFAENRELVLADDAQCALRAYSWPGNVRELRNVMRRVAILAEEGLIREGDLPPEITTKSPIRAVAARWIQCLMNDQASSDEIAFAYSECVSDVPVSFSEVIGRVEKNLLRFALREADGNQAKAARLLQMNPSTFRDRLKKYGLMRYVDSWKSPFVPSTRVSRPTSVARS
jgi:transcriptional regulator with GAF, ATPase, and Fis domain